NPELDMVRPDFAAMYQMAGELDEIAARLDKATLDKARSTLVGRRVKSDKPAGTAAEGDKPAETEAPRGDSPRLYFDLKSAAVIRDLMTTQTKVQRNRGPVTDLWDRGPSLGNDKRGQPIVLPWLLVAVVSLFSAEWLIRKLLRLA